MQDSETAQGPKIFWENILGPSAFPRLQSHSFQQNFAQLSKPISFSKITKIIQRCHLMPPIVLSVNCTFYAGPRGRDARAK